MRKTILLLLTFSAIFLACNSSKKLSSYQFDKLDKQGHRGARGLMPENTIPAMITALDLGVTTLEMDVVITKDKQVVLSHEPFFNHDITTIPGGKFIEGADEMNYNIYQMDYALVKSFDVGLKPHPNFPKQKKIPAYKPLLTDVFAAVNQSLINIKRPPVQYNIEIKSKPATDGVYHPAVPEYTNLLMKVIRDNGMEDHVMIQSFDMRALQYLHKKYPAIRTVLLVDAGNKNSFRKQLKDLGFTPTVYSPDQSMVTAGLIAECHEQNIRIIPWTVNTKEKIKAFVALGVDGIITDYPDLFD
ncbi:MAG: Glycerophosphodiester phosphodiesterase [Ferruginibacter sp.]|nr:Glycerophosphodiester phosphodiesterase [Ferruginibacter sp.]